MNAMIDTVQVTMVPTEHIDEIWEGDVKTYLEGAAEYTYGRYEIDDIYDAIVKHNHTLWVAFYGPKIKGAVVTTILRYPKKTCLSGVFLGGVELETWKVPMLTLLKQWAHDNNCDGFEMCGRLGWARALKDEGYRALWQTCEFPVAEAGLGEQNG